jgi:hypothetical protein
MVDNSVEHLVVICNTDDGWVHHPWKKPLDWNEWKRLHIEG